MKLGTCAHLAAAAGVAMCMAAEALGTWSIVITNRRTGEVGVGCATCLTELDLEQATPVMLVGVGGASAQSAVDISGFNRTGIRDRLLLRTDPAQILTQVRVGDNNANNRQFGIADVLGRRATYTGPGAAAWAGGVIGEFGEYSYAVQGNILTGPNVVNDARDALINTPGDLPVKLMAAMEAARAGGGDGRCSCTTGTPTSCGSPPPSFQKSAHIGYMIVGRLGDLDAAVASYRTGVSPVGVAVGDLNLNGTRDVVVINNGTSSASILQNLGPGGAAIDGTAGRFARLGVAASSSFVGSPRGVVLRDVNGDLRPDAFVAAQTGGQVIAKPITASGTLGAQSVAAVGAGPVGIALADLGGTAMPEIITANFNAGSVSVVPITGATSLLITMGSAVNTAVGGSPNAVAVGDWDADLDTDVMVADLSGSRVVPLLNNAGTLTAAPAIAVAGGSADVAAGDFDLDGDDDVAVVCTNDISVFVLHNAGGVFTPVRHALPFVPGQARAGDVTGDGRSDVVVIGLNAFAVLSLPDGSPPVLSVYPGPTDFMNPAWTALDLADMDNDADLDIVAAHATNPGGVSIIENLGGSGGRPPGTFLPGVGLAAGDYFMDFNVAGAQFEDPDPVITLRQQFDAWRAALVGVTDAVQSSAEASHESLPPECAGGVTITLRDWQGSLVTGSPTVEVVHAPGSAGRLAIGAVQQLGAGVYRASLTTGAAPLTVQDVLNVRVTAPGARPVVLMPAVRVRALAEPLHDIDWNNDGLFPDVQDFHDFVAVFSGSPCSPPCDTIDFNRDGLFPDVLDLEDFLLVFAGRGC